MTKKLDKFTFGNSPACILLVDLINKLDPVKYGRLHSKQQALNRSLNELMQAYLNKQISASNLLKIIKLMREDMKQRIQKIKDNDKEIYATDEEKKLQSDIFNVFSNVIMMSFKKLIREITYHNCVYIRSLDKARAMAKKLKRPGEGEFLISGYYGVIPYQSSVVLKQGQKPQVVITSKFEDTINNEVLFEKHYARMKRKNIQYD